MKRSRVMVSLFAIMIGLSSLSISFSLAWYASSTRLEVRNIEVRMDDKEKNLLISKSIEIETFKKELDQEKDELSNPLIYKPVSSMESYEWLDKKEDTPKFKDSSVNENVYGRPVSYIAKDGYFQQELYLLCDDDVLVTVDPLKTFLKSDHDANAEYVKENKLTYQGRDLDEVIEELDNLEKCLRMSILIVDDNYYDYAIIEPNKNGETLLGGVLDNSNDEYYDTYKDQNNGKWYEIVYGEITNRDKIIYDEPNIEDIYFDGEKNAFNANHKGNAYRFNQEKSIANGVGIKVEETLELDDLKGIEPKFAIPLKRDTPRKICLSIYLEGWDKDNVNKTMGGNFLGLITFKIVRELAEEVK